MKQIIDNKLYDTEKSTLIFKYIKNVPEKRYFLFQEYEINCWRNVDLYKTSKENFFIHIKQRIKDENSSVLFEEKEEYIEQISREEAKKIVQKLDVNKAIELFGEVEEA